MQDHYNHLSHLWAKLLSYGRIYHPVFSVTSIGDCAIVRRHVKSAFVFFSPGSHVKLGDVSVLPSWARVLMVKVIFFNPDFRMIPSCVEASFSCSDQTFKLTQA